MKIKNIGIIIPWMDPLGHRCMTRFKFTEEVDRRQARQLIKKAFKPTGIRLDNRQIDYYIKHRSYPLVDTENPSNS